MKVVLLGATGFSGKEVLQELLSQNHIVTAITRKASSIQYKNKNLRIVEGNVLDPVFIQKILEDQDAVINCLGIGGKGTGKPNSFVSDATTVLVKAMERSGTKRLICMSNVGAGDSMAFQPWIFRALILPYFMKWLKVIIDDKNKMESVIWNSNLDWIIIRCPNITDKPSKGKARPTLDGKGLKLSITNKDLAAFLVEQLTTNQFLHQSPCVSN